MRIDCVCMQLDVMAICRAPYATGATLHLELDRLLWYGYMGPTDLWYNMRQAVKAIQLIGFREREIKGSIWHVLVAMYKSAARQLCMQESITDWEREMLYLLMLGLVTLGSFLQEGSGTTAVRREFCQPFDIVKTFNLRDPITNKPCTLQIRAIICGGFCASDAAMSLKYHESTTGTYQLRASPVADCKCCEALHQPLLHDAPPMALTCLEGQKWNYTVKIPVSSSRDCICRTCSSSNTLDWRLPSHYWYSETNHIDSYIATN